MGFVLENKSHSSVEFIARGGSITRVNVADRLGHIDNVVLGLPSEKDYQGDHPYFGALVGRFSGRIANARFALDGQEYVLSANNGRNHIAGGFVGFDKKDWAVERLSNASARLTYVSPDGEEGFPGTLTTVVTYTLTDENALEIGYEATTDRTTVLNLTNHSYFNLAGEGNGSVEDHILTIHADQVIEVDKDLIATGRFLDVAGTLLDFRKPVAIGAGIRSSHPLVRFAKGYDCSYVLRGEGLRHVARAYEPRSGRILDVETTEPSLAFYSGNFLDGGFVGARGNQYRQGDAFTLEPRHLPDSPNQASFPTTVLHPGETYRAKTVYRFSTDLER